MHSEIEIKRLEKALAKVQKLPSIGLKLSSTEAYCLFAQLQFALRHPLNNDSSAQMIRNIAEGIQIWIGECVPEMKPFMELGWKPDNDIEVQPVVAGEIKFTDLSFSRKENIAIQGLALAIAVEQIAHLSGDSFEQVQKIIQTHANWAVANYSQEEIDRVAYYAESRLSAETEDIESENFNVVSSVNFRKITDDD